MKQLQLIGLAFLLTGCFSKNVPDRIEIKSEIRKAQTFEIQKGYGCEFCPGGSTWHDAYYKYCEAWGESEPQLCLVRAGGYDTVDTLIEWTQEKIIQNEK